MLGLARRKGEEVIIIKDGLAIGVVKIIDAQGGKVSIGFQFPKEYQIMRRELLMGEKREAK